MSHASSEIKIPTWLHGSSADGESAKIVSGGEAEGALLILLSDPRSLRRVMPESGPSDAEVRAAAEILVFVRNASASAAPRAKQGLWSVWGGWFRGLVTNPLLLLVAGAVLTYSLGPRLTQKWHNQEAKLDSDRAQLELKIQLLRQMATLSVKEVGFIDDGFSSRLGLSTNTSSRLRASTRRGWIQESTDVEGKLSAWFPATNTSDTPTSLALRWVHLENRTLDFEAQQAGLEALFATHSKATKVTSAADQAAISAANDKSIEKQLRILHHMRSAREQDGFAKPNGPFTGLWKAVDDARLDARPETDISGSIGAHAVRLEAAIHSAAIAELNDARERLARRLLSSSATGYR